MADEEERGYREQMTDLTLNDTTAPRARDILDLHRAILPDRPDSRGRIRATEDYLNSQAREERPDRKREER